VPQINPYKTRSLIILFYSVPFLLLPTCGQSESSPMTEMATS
jgi:hypothetical protein